MTIVGGATEVTEASIRKMAFNIMLKIVDTWGKYFNIMLKTVGQRKLLPCKRPKMTKTSLMPRFGNYPCFNSVVVKLNKICAPQVAK